MVSAEQKPARLDFDFDLSTLSGDPMQQTMVDESRKVAEAMSGGSAAAQSTFSAMVFDLSKLGLHDSGRMEPLLDSNRQEAPVDLASIDLNLDKAAASTNTTPRDDHWYDVQTKFDLAKAYEAMGDKEGAREILRVVIDDGGNEQQVAAQRVLETLT
jgi:pilus assembly protein FimV